jgi:hypothetical protein
VLVDEHSWLLRSSADRRAILGRHPMRRRRSGSWRGCGGVGPTLWSFGGRRSGDWSTPPGCMATSACTFGGDYTNVVGFRSR